jgi:S1-C subfamily serine protease
LISAVRERGLQDTEFGKHDEEVASWALQITAAAAPGSSGSPILRGDGQVVGVLVGNLRPLEGVHFGIAVAKVQSLLSSAAADTQPLTSVSGARSIRTNLLISGAFFAGLALVWVLSSHLHRRFQTRLRPVKH